MSKQGSGIYLSFGAYCLMLFVATACAATPSPPPALEPAATPTLLGTVLAPTREPPTPTPRPETCVFRSSPDREFGVYRFNWENATFSLSTKIGPVIVDGPRSLLPGPRQLVLTHIRQAEPPAVVVNFDPGGSLLYDLTLGAQEVRDAGGSVVLQTLADSANDTLGMPAYLDIVRVERSYGYYPNNVVRVYLAGVHSGALIWSHQDVAVEAGGRTFTYRKTFDDKQEVFGRDSQGRVQPWEGAVSVESNVVAFELQSGVGAPVTASTATSSGPVDSAGPFPVQSMQALWDLVGVHCP